MKNLRSFRIIPAEEPDPKAFLLSLVGQKDVIEEDERVDIKWLKVVGGFGCRSGSTGENIVKVMLYGVYRRSRKVAWEFEFHSLRQRVGTVCPAFPWLSAQQCAVHH